MVPLFAYGTLKRPHIQEALIGRLLDGEADVLEGYRKTTVTLSDQVYPDIVVDSESRVEGLVVYVTSRELAIMDRYEDTDYIRFEVILASGRSAWVYQALRTRRK